MRLEGKGSLRKRVCWATATCNYLAGWGWSHRNFLNLLSAALSGHRQEFFPSNRNRSCEHHPQFHYRHLPYLHIQWKRLDDYLSTQFYLEATEKTWREAARIYFELRRKGITLSSPVDCCIAQIAIESKVLLLHRDEDFERIARIRPLAIERFSLKLS